MSQTQHAETDTAASRAARERQAARDRARRWREERQAEAEALRAEAETLRARVAHMEAELATAEVDAILVVGLARAIARDKAGQAAGEVPVTGGLVTVRAVLDQAAKAGRNAGGDYVAVRDAVGARLLAAVEAVARPVA